MYQNSLEITQDNKFVDNICSLPSQTLVVCNLKGYTSCFSTEQDSESNIKRCIKSQSPYFFKSALETNHYNDNIICFPKRCSEPVRMPHTILAERLTLLLYTSHENLFCLGRCANSCAPSNKIRTAAELSEAPLGR